MTLFQSREFTAHSGARLGWKVECDTLSDEDWWTLAGIVGAHLKFSEVDGVPTGGMRFAEPLRSFARPGFGLLIADDVLTTGASMEEHRAGRDAIGVVAFARTRRLPPWVRAVWMLAVDSPEGR